MPSWMSLSLQNSSSPIMEQLIFFHDHVMIIVIVIMLMISYSMIILFSNKLINRLMLESNLVETFWTIIPIIILVFIALPSLKILYLMDEINNPTITLKTLGHQWYWSYEYSDFNIMEFDSYMIPQNEMKFNTFRLLDVDNRTTLPISTFIRMIITSSDVIHSWTIPSLGIKVDASPGRLNQLSFWLNRPGIFFGQCSEICGSNHSFMPIVIESINIKNFIN
uniref:Cytochrome c oxidase subunit 2 n=1 Tax=Attaphila sp. B MD-2019 TaxID=2603108 RepID=A0A7G3KDY9_9NEOP|nr:cytochrome oxidase subunit II [Attaphila sp. B MD-2019]